MKANSLKYISYSSIILLMPFIFIRAENNIIGINEINLNKIPIGIIDLNLPDTDQDGLDNELEKSLSTNINKADSDNDGFDDKTEIENNYNPLSKGKIIINQILANKLKGKYLLRVEKFGELWYVNPLDSKRYLAGNSARKKLLIEKLNPSIPTPITDNNSVINNLASAIRANDKVKVLSLVDSSYQGRVGYTMDALNNEQKLLWANMLSSAELKSESSTLKTYTADVYFGLASKNVTVEFQVTKQPDEKWLISKL